MPTAIDSTNFTQIYEAEPLTPVERGAVAALLLASANERLITNARADLQVLAQLLPRIAADAEWELDYWRRVDTGAFPLAAWLRSGNG